MLCDSGPSESPARRLRKQAYFSMFHGIDVAICMVKSLPIFRCNNRPLVARRRSYRTGLSLLRPRVRLWHISNMARCPTRVRNAQKSGRRRELQKAGRSVAWCAFGSALTPQMPRAKLTHDEPVSGVAHRRVGIGPDSGCIFRVWRSRATFNWFG